jgi:choline dehydrogenase-like flavoprotein
MRWKILDRFARAAAEAGIPEVSDFNTGDNFGAGYFQVNQKRGVRWSAARGFLKPVLGRRNLRVETGATVERVVFDGLRASGVVWRKAGRREQAQCRGETILSAGAVQTPKLLELSGIGDGRRLSDLGIPIVRHLAGVGENLQDHLQLRPVFAVSGDPTLNELYAHVWRRPLMALEYALFRRGPMTMAPSQMGAFAFSGPGKTRPDLQFHVQPLSLDAFGEPLHRTPAITVSVCNLRPSSRGGCHAVSPDPQAPPAIDPNYLSSPDDIGVAVASLRLARRIMSMPALAAAAPREVRPGPELVSEEALALAARDIATTIFHPVGTARMGVSGDPLAVTDDRLRVVGVTGLRVIDASVMPRITSGNTNAPTLMIAEKGASMLIEDARA